MSGFQAFFPFYFPDKIKNRKSQKIRENKRKMKITIKILRNCAWSYIAKYF